MVLMAPSGNVRVKVCFSKIAARMAPTSASPPKRLRR
jgi:hypothetical protein